MRHSIMVNDLDLVKLIDKHVDCAEDLAKKLMKEGDKATKIAMLDELHEAHTLIAQIIKAHQYVPTT